MQTFIAIATWHEPGVVDPIIATGRTPELASSNLDKAIRERVADMFPDEEPEHRENASDDWERHAPQLHEVR